jgi:hypothetical protein
MNVNRDTNPMELAYNFLYSQSVTNIAAQTDRRHWEWYPKSNVPEIDFFLLYINWFDQYIVSSEAKKVQDKVVMFLSQSVQDLVEFGQLIFS